MDWGWSRMIASEEDKRHNVCIRAVALDGYSPEQAEYCNAGSLGCRQCPFQASRPEVEEE